MYFWIYIIEIIYRQLYNKRNCTYGYSPITDYQESEVRYEEINNINDINIRVINETIIGKSKRVFTNLLYEDILHGKIGQ